MVLSSQHPPRLLRALFPERRRKGAFFKERNKEDPTRGKRLLRAEKRDIPDLLSNTTQQQDEPFLSPKVVDEGPPRSKAPSPPPTTRFFVKSSAKTSAFFKESTAKEYTLLRCQSVLEAFFLLKGKKRRKDLSPARPKRGKEFRFFPLLKHPIIAKPL